MAVEHLEIERKFDVGAGFALPDLTGLPGVASVGAPVEHELEAAYYDTADLRLARARVTLRRRTGGTDAGWHVKLPAVAGGRRELHSPVGRAARTPPKAVLAPVLGIVRTAPATQVALLRTRRVVTELLGEDGRVLAEVADDHVSGTAFPAGPGEAAVVTAWREVEVELVDGDEDLLAAVADALVAAGAAPATSPAKLSRVLADRLAALAGPAPAAPVKAKGKGGKKKHGKKAAGPRPVAADVVRTVLREQLQGLQDADLMVRTGQPDGVHQVRVACRRLRSVLAVFRPVLDPERTEPLRAALQEVGRTLSGTRDSEVTLAHLREVVAAQPVELVLGPVAARLQQTEIRDTAAGEKAALRSLGDPQYLRLLDELDALAADPPFTEWADEPADEVARAVLRGAVKRLTKRVDAAVDADDDQALHDVRKAAKRLRYTAEAVAPVLGAPVRTLVKELKGVQEVLGDRQDTFITRQLCHDLGLQAFAAGENAWTWGRLHALEEARAADAERAFWQRWPQLRPVLAGAVR
ncbi:CYTH and CHAD domain-containing protein [Modestobacter sp. NPDC049651]|uniref:CYTH and CHAD domain-containing protein n=1 Tax=unclassified Modestobacter TaxID=2643866 RepID=UPI003410BA9C